MRRDLIFDLGMHRGEDTAYYLQKGFRVVAFEANPELVNSATRRFAQPIAEGRLMIVSGAISDTTEASVTFYVHPTVSVWGTTEPAWVERNLHAGQSTPVTVPTVNFADSLDRFGVPYFLKIDIEGSDLKPLSALGSVPHDERPALISLEANQTEWSQLVSEFDRLESLGFSRFAIVQQALLGQLRQPIMTLDGEWIDYAFEDSSSGPFGDDLRTNWVDRRSAIARYEKVFRRYRVSRAFDRLPKASSVRFRVGQRFVVALPGWFDTHAMRLSAD